MLVERWRIEKRRPVKEFNDFKIVNSLYGCRTCPLSLIQPPSQSNIGMLEDPWLGVELREWFAYHRSTFSFLKTGDTPGQLHRHLPPTPCRLHFSFLLDEPTWRWSSINFLFHFPPSTLWAAALILQLSYSFPAAQCGRCYRSYRLNLLCFLYTFPQQSQL